MRAVVIEDFNGSIELVRDPDTCDVLVFEDLESAWEEANRCQNGSSNAQYMNLEDRIMEEASKGNYNKVYALALLYLCKKYKEGI